MKPVNVVCFGGNDWWYHNRAHFDVQIIKCYGQYGTVLYINSIVMQKPLLRRKKRFVSIFSRKMRSIFRGLKDSNEGFWVYSPFSLPVHHINWLRPLNTVLLWYQIKRINRKLGISKPIIWVACPAACDVALGMERSCLVYQRTDRFEDFPNVDIQIVENYDRRLKAIADLTLYANMKLCEEESAQCKKALYVDHGVNYTMFVSAENDGHIPADMIDISRPLVGFFGDIAEHTVDIDFISEVIDHLPDMSFVFIGDASADCSSLRQKKNVRMLGMKPYKEIPHYGKCFDVAVMPWHQNSWIDACNPIKLKEYLALGKPIISTPFAELQKYQDVVYIAKTPEEFAECIKKALAEDNSERTAARRKKVQNASWENKAKLVLHEILGQDEIVSESI